MAEAFVSLVLDGAVATVTMNRPEKRNALSSTQDCDDFVDAFRQLEANASAVNCIVLTGAGRSFCAGGDLKTMKARQGIGRQHSPAETRENYRRGIQRLIEVLWNCEIPTIAAVNGNALGLGLDLACLCDIRIAADNATFASSFIKVGLIPGDGGAWILPRTVGLSRASEMIFTGDSIDAHAAHSLGLVSRIAPEDRLLSEALALARQIASKPARALRLAKRLIREGQHQRLADVLQLSAAFQALTHETKDHEEALDAFLEKRAPVFTGR